MKSREEIESQTVQVALNIDCGEIAYADWLEPYKLEKEDFNVNETKGTKESILAHGKNGLFHGYVGDSSPSIYKDGDKYYIGRRAYDKKTYEEITEGSKIPGVKIGQVHTELRWYSLADKAEYLSRGGKKIKKNPGTYDPKSFKVTPGRYVLKHTLNTFTDSYANTEVLYATLELSSEPVVNIPLPEEEMYSQLLPFIASDEQLSVNPHYECVDEKKHKYEFKGYEIFIMNKKTYTSGFMRIAQDTLPASPEKIIARVKENGVIMEKVMQLNEKLNKEKNKEVQTSIALEMEKILKDYINTREKLSETVD